MTCWVRRTCACGRQFVTAGARQRATCGTPRRRACIVCGRQFLWCRNKSICSAPCRAQRQKLLWTQREIAKEERSANDHPNPKATRLLVHAHTGGQGRPDPVYDPERTRQGSLRVGVADDGRRRSAERRSSADNPPSRSTGARR